MKKLLARTTVVLALAGLAVPALACEMMKQQTTASTAQEKSAEKKTDKVEKKAEKKQEKTATNTVADAKR